VTASTVGFDFVVAFTFRLALNASRRCFISARAAGDRALMRSARVSGRFAFVAAVAGFAVAFGAVGAVGAVGALVVGSSLARLKLAISSPLSGRR
jgi:hypothetical protein